MYRIISTISFLVRFAICYLTIEAVPIFHSELWTAILAQTVPIYSLMLFISYSAVGRVFGYESGSFPALGAVLYFIVYVPLALALWIILLTLTATGILPIPI